MSKIIHNVQKKFSRMERGQVLVVVALAAVGIIAIIGLVIDVGIMFIGNARLRRAVDAAALSSALQFREGYDINTLTDAANEFLIMDGFSNPRSTVATCDNNPTNMNLGCVTGQAARKLVGVYATADVKLAFLPIIGINSVPISAQAVSETASLDVVLVIDRSESMTYTDASGHKLNPGDPMRDPYWCNNPSLNGLSDAQRTYNSKIDNAPYVLTSACQPFFQVIGAAIDFTKILFFPYDELSIVTFDKDPGVDRNTKPYPTWPGTLPLCTGTRCANLSLGQDCPNGTSGCTPNDAVIPTLENLTVIQGDDPPYKNATSYTDDYRGYGGVSGACVGGVYQYWAQPPVMGAGSNYWGLIGQGQDVCPPGPTPPPDPSRYTTTNIGGGLEMAGNQLATDTRQDVLWVVILLTDGVPNAGYSDNVTVTVHNWKTGADLPSPLPQTFCPSSTWVQHSPTLPVCVIGDATSINNDWYRSTRPIPTDPSYDALTYAMDQADFVGLPYAPHATPPTYGQNALLYTIGLGSELTNYPITGFTDPVTSGSGEGLGTIFLNYAANVGRGLYFPAPNASDLTSIFRSIGSDIATRLAK
jgi:Flp pilus assembly protein TadG